MVPKKRPDAVQQTGNVPATELQERFGLNFKLLRKRAGLTQVQVAEQAGIVQNEISRIELGKVNVTLGTMQRLARVIDLDVENLLSRSPQPGTKK